jgi:hypothetical protein
MPLTPTSTNDGIVLTKLSVAISVNSGKSCRAFNGHSANNQEVSRLLVE